MKSAARSVLPAALARVLLLVAAPIACDPGDSDDNDISAPSGQAGGEDDDDDDDDDDDEPADDESGDESSSQFDACVDAAWAYTDQMQTCDGAGDNTIADVEIVCDLEQRPDSVWPHCIDEVEAMTACGAEVGCADWWTAACWDENRAMLICFGAEDPGAEPPSSSCQWPNDGECDEPEGTNLCAEGTDVDDCAGAGGGGACDPDYCSGCDTTCDEYSCYTCCYSCSGDSCEQSCDF